MSVLPDYCYCITSKYFEVLCINVFFGTSTFYSLPAAGLFSCSWLRGTHGARRDTMAQVWALTEVRGTCSGGSKWQVPTGSDSEHVEPSRPMQTHVQVKIMSDGSCDPALISITVRLWCSVHRVMHDHLSHLLKLLLIILRPTNINKVAVRVWYSVHRVMHDDLSHLLKLLLIILRPTNINKVAYISYISIAMYLVLRICTNTHWVPQLSDFDPLDMD